MTTKLSTDDVTTHFISKGDEWVRLTYTAGIGAVSYEDSAYEYKTLTREQNAEMLAERRAAGWYVCTTRAWTLLAGGDAPLT